MGQDVGTRDPMGLAADGRMRQELYPDPNGLATWSPTNSGRLFVRRVYTMPWREITREEPPATAANAKSHAKAGLPWFEL